MGSPTSTRPTTKSTTASKTGARHGVAPAARQWLTLYDEHEDEHGRGLIGADADPEAVVDAEAPW